MRRQIGSRKATEQTLRQYSQVGPRKRLAKKYSQTIVVGEPFRRANVFQDWQGAQPG